jgi:hypothetical protein
VTSESPAAAVFGYSVLGAFAVLVLLTVTRTIDDVAGWVLAAMFTAEQLHTLAAGAAVLVVVVVVAFAGLRSVGAGRLRVHFHPGSDPNLAVAIRHEALGHAAVAHGVGCTGIKARIEADGSGWVDYSPPKGVTPTERLAITQAGEALAGPEGCKKDRIRARKWIRQGADPQVAAAITSQHVGNAFGRKVAKALERNGRFG